MVEFARKLGITHGMVSRYESGSVTPSKSVLLNLLPMAETDFEKASICGEMGDVDVAFREACDELMEVFQEELRKHASSPETRKLFMDLAAEAARQNEVPSALLRILQAWKRYNHIQEVRNELNEAATRIEKVGEGMLVPARRADRPQADPDTRYIVMIRCPQTRKALDTMWTTDREGWKNAEFEKQRVKCPHCHGYHDWTKEDAFLRRES